MIKSNRVECVKPIFNQICSSDFIKDDWLKHINYRPFNNVKYQYRYDFRYSGYGFFQMLKSLCELVSQFVDNQLIEFYNKTLFSEIIQSPLILNATIKSITEQFKSTTSNLFLETLNTIRTVIQQNQFVNRLKTNFQLATHPVGIIWQPGLTSRPMVYSSLIEGQKDCACMTSSFCIETTGIYTNSSTFQVTTNNIIIQGYLEYQITGINVGCFMLDAVLQSNLSCLYNQSCLSRLTKSLAIDSPFPFNVKPLMWPNSTLSNENDSILTIGELMKNLMIDQWKINSNYDGYFKACKSKICTYTYVQQFNIIYVLTQTIAFIGGIATILRLIILPTVTFIRRWKIVRRQSTDQSKYHLNNFTILIYRYDNLSKIIKTLDISSIFSSIIV